MNGNKWDFFIAHPNALDEKASELYSLLEERKFKVFADHLRMKPGATWTIDIDEALKNSFVTLILISTNSINDSFYTQTEVVSALHLAKSFPEDYKVIPIYLNGLPDNFMDIHYSLRLIQGIDVLKAGGLQNVANKLGNLLRDTSHGFKNPTEKEISAGQTHALHSFPTGPLVEEFLVRRSIIEAFAKLTKSSEAKLILSEANAFRLEGDPNMNPDNITVNPIYLPDPFQSLFNFWQSAFSEACLHGPRMLAAIILTLSPDRFPSQAKADRQILLEKIKNY